MATIAASSLTLPNTPFFPQSLPKISSHPVLSFSNSLRPFTSRSKALSSLQKSENHQSVSFAIKAQALEFTGSFFEGRFGSDDDSASPSGSGVTTVEDKQEPQCPPGLRHYETMAVLRPDMSEDERLRHTQTYEELLVAGGGMYVDVFNRVAIPLAYSIKKKNKVGESNTYLDGIYLLFTYFTKPESITALQTILNTDDDVVRSSTFNIRKRKY